MEKIESYKKYHEDGVEYGIARLSELSHQTGMKTSFDGVEGWSISVERGVYTAIHEGNFFCGAVKDLNAVMDYINTRRQYQKPTYSPDTSSYIAPTPEELEHLLFKRIAPALGIKESKGLSLAALADIDRKKIGQWCSGSGQIPYSVLYTLVHKGLGVKITCANWRHELLQSVGEVAA